MSFAPSDLLTVLLLVVLEGLLSADNAMVLAVLVLGLPRDQQQPALRYGIIGAFVATFLGQAVGWYRADQGAGLIGATVGAIVVLFIWHRLVASRTISDPGVTGRRWL